MKKKQTEKIGSIIYANKQAEYELLDCGFNRKLERFNDIVINRPESQALAPPKLPRKTWQQANAIFEGNKQGEHGKWQFPHGKLPDVWQMKLNELPLLARFTSFRHVGVFPEQSPHWRKIETVIGGKKMKMLNLFGYTGIASLVAARAGAEVVHVDASKKAVGWAQENQANAKLSDKPIRWIVDDAKKFCAREIRRGQSYDIILLDPPNYGRGPKGEIWQLANDLPELLQMVAKLQSTKHKLTILTCYAIRLSAISLHQLAKNSFGDGKIESGELVLANDSQFISTSLFSTYETRYE